MDEERIDRMIAALACASADDFPGAMAQLAESGYDTLGALEEALRLFVQRLTTTTAQNVQVFAALAEAKAEVDEKLRTIERQQVAILELQVPVIDVWPGILLLPLVGLIDSQRASDVTEQLLMRIAGGGQAEWVILDLTGVGGVDAPTAQHLLRLSQAVRMLGVRCILTGIGGDLARVLVTAGTALDDMLSLRSLRDGLAYCMNRSVQAKKGRTLGTTAD